MPSSTDRRAQFRRQFDAARELLGKGSKSSANAVDIALAKLATTDPNLWVIFHELFNRNNQIRVALLILIVLGSTNNKYVEMVFQLLLAQGNIVSAAIAHGISQ